MSLEFCINGQAIKCDVPKPMVSGTINYYGAQFHFKGDDWDELSKTAHFKYGSAVYDVELDDDDEIPPESGINLPAGVWKVFVSGIQIKDGQVVRRLTTDSCSFTVKNFEGGEGASFPNFPASLVEQLAATVSMLQEEIKFLKDEIDALKGNTETPPDSGSGESPVCEHILATDEEVEYVMNEVLKTNDIFATDEDIKNTNEEVFGIKP